jgi:hypothetical protein
MTGKPDYVTPILKNPAEIAVLARNTGTYNEASEEVHLVAAGKSYFLTAIHFVCTHNGFDNTFTISDGLGGPPILTFMSLMDTDQTPRQTDVVISFPTPVYFAISVGFNKPGGCAANINVTGYEV